MQALASILKLTIVAFLGLVPIFLVVASSTHGIPKQGERRFIAEAMPDVPRDLLPDGVQRASGRLVAVLLAPTATAPTTPSRQGAVRVVATRVASLQATVTSLQARVDHLEATVAALTASEGKRPTPAGTPVPTTMAPEAAISSEECRNPFANLPEAMQPKDFPFNNCDGDNFPRGTETPAGREPTQPPAAQATIEAQRIALATEVARSESALDTVAELAAREAALRRQATVSAAAQTTSVARNTEVRATEEARATNAALVVEATLAAYATQQAASNEDFDELARQAAQAAALATGAAISAQATIAVLVSRDAAQVTEIAALQAQATFARGTVSPLSAAQAEIVAQDMIIDSQATNVAALEDIATQNTISAAHVATAQAESAARATEIAALQAQQVDAQVTATALAVVVANSVLDPTRQSLTVQTDLGGMLAGDQDALTAARQALETPLGRYPLGQCRAGFVLISGKAGSIEDGVQLARRVDALLREYWPDIFTPATGSELFALPNEEPFGEATVDIFFYSGCQPIG